MTTQGREKTLDYKLALFNLFLDTKESVSDTGTPYRLFSFKAILQPELVCISICHGLLS